jgi:NAD(P)-dependent dehydrogenase (short-subunit alcohol dehydrogenase family)
MSAQNGKGPLAGMAALITGGGTGIGRGIALEFAAAGARVAISGRRRETLEETAQAVRAAGGTCECVCSDVSSAADAQRMVGECVAKFGGLQILVNNAGMARFGTVENTADADIAAIVGTNLTGLMFMTKAAIPELVKHGGTASIVNIASSVGERAIKAFSVYSATKAAVIHFTRCVALDLGEQKVRVNCINPGVVETPIFGTAMPATAVTAAMKQFESMTPLGRVGQPADIARTAVFLARPDNNWMTGAIVTHDGGISLV